LKLRDYQAQTLTWLHQVESDNNAERALAFTCPEFISSRDLDKDDIEDVDIPPWIRIGMEIRGFPIFYSLSESAFFVYSPTTTRREKFINYRVPVNGVALCDNPGSGKTIVSLALIHSRPFVSVKHLGADVTCFMPSRATLIICPVQLSEQWEEEALRCMLNANIVMITVIVGTNG
jgi:SNF2 family DNA or RNA helicase